MSIWVLVAIFGMVLVAISVVVALSVTRVLGRIAHDVSSALDQELWSSAPLMREIEEAVDHLSERRARRHASASEK